MASPQCLGYSHYRKVTRNMCDPPKSVILSTLRKEIKRINAQYIFVATDHDPMINELEKAFGHMNVSVSSWTFFCLSSLFEQLAISEVCAQRRTTSSKFFSAILVFLCLGHTKTKENRTNSEP